MQQAQDDPEKKLDWMYKKPGQNVNHEEYLLGRSIDKEFETLAQEERIKNQVNQGIAPKNHVEHECVPFSIRSYRDAPQEQVDMARKLQEDPLVAIKKREMESRQQLLQNPVKLKELHRILKEEKMKKLKKKKKKKKSDDQDKPKKSKSKKKSLGLEEEEKNLDDILAEKYAKLKAALDESLDMGSLLKAKKEKMKDHSSDNKSDQSSDEKNKIRNRKSNYSSKQESRNREDIDRSRNKYRNEDRHSTSKRHQDDEKYGNRISRKHDNNDEKSYSSRRQDSSRYDDYKTTESKYKKEDPKSRHDRSRERNDRYNRETDHKHEKTDDKYDKYNKVKTNSYNDNDSSQSHYGLVSADGKKIELKGVNKIREKPVENKLAAKKQYVGNKRPKLTEEEIEKRRKEMHDNALWRDKQLESNIKRYKEDDQKEHQKNHSEFDTDFLKKQLAKAAEQGSLESRIKSNINNIQRSGRAMDINFAKR